MITKNITEQEFADFCSISELKNFYQTREWKKLKEIQESSTMIIGCFDGNKLICASLLILFPMLKKFTFAYAPRGLITNYENSELLEKCISSLKEFLKQNKIVFLRIDPEIVLNHIDTNGVSTNDTKGHSIYDNLIKLGFKHYGFNLGFEAFQARFNHVIYLENTYEETEKNFAKSTRKNIETSKDMGVVVKKGTVNDLEEAYKLFDLTASRKNFDSYSYQFYKNLMETFGEKVTLYLTYIYPQKYKENYIQKLEEERKTLDEIHNKMQHDNVGRKLITKEETSKRLIEKYQNEIEYSDSLGQNPILISSLLSIESGNQYISFISGMKSEFKNFYPKYAMYSAHIHDAIERNLQVVNFYGIKGIFDKNDKDYGIYEIKKTFGGESLEFIGQFDLPINKFLYFIYKRR